MLNKTTLVRMMPNHRHCLQMLVICIGLLTFSCIHMSWKVSLAHTKDYQQRTGSISKNKRRQLLSQAEVVDHLRHRCHGNEERYHGNFNEKEFLDHMYINHRFKVVYCGVEKVGLTFWRRVFRVLNDTKEQRSPYQIHPFLAYQGDEFAHVTTFSDIPSNEREHILKSYSKFMFTRNPYERLFSAYIDKLYFPNGNYWSALGEYIVKTYRRRPDSSNNVCGHNVTFSEIVTFVIENQKTLYYRDNHFVPTYEHCRPCHINYSFIGQLDNFSDDTMKIMTTIGAKALRDKLVDFKEEASNDQFVQDVYFLFWFKKDTSRCLSFYESLKRLWETMKIRGLIHSAVELPFDKTQSDVLNEKQLLKALKQARGNAKYDKRKAKRYALRQAYATIDSERLNKLKEIFQADCDLFGYDCEIQNIFKD